MNIFANNSNFIFVYYTDYQNCIIRVSTAVEADLVSKRVKENKRGMDDPLSSRPKLANMDHQFEFMLYIPVNFFQSD